LGHCLNAGLRFGESDFKLNEVPNTPPAGPVGLSAQLGYRYVTFLVKDASGLCRRLQEKNVPFLMPEHESRLGVRLAMVQDPDGNIIETPGPLAAAGSIRENRISSL
jgi:hypothetical protein